MAWLLGFIKIVILLGTLVTIHELGHFLVAKACNVKVHKFAIGFGPKLFTKVKGETEYTLRAIPFGGFVQLEGEDERSDDERAFNKKPVWQRILIIIAGATVNIIFSLIVYYGICVATNAYIGMIGAGFGSDGTIAYLQPGMVAEEVGLKINDRLISINGKSNLPIEEYTNIIKISPNKELEIVVERSGEELTYVLTPEVRSAVFSRTSNVALSNLNFWENSHYAIKETGYYFTETLKAFATLITGKAQEAAVMGPVGIAEQITRTRGWSDFFYLMSAISLSLGIFNLLPVPGLDGGKFLFLVIEGVRRKPMKEKTEISWQLAGMALIIAIALVVTVKDVLNLF